MHIHFYSEMYTVHTCKFLNFVLFLDKKVFYKTNFNFNSDLFSENNWFFTLNGSINLVQLMAYCLLVKAKKNKSNVSFIIVHVYV